MIKTGVLTVMLLPSAEYICGPAADAPIFPERGAISSCSIILCSRSNFKLQFKPAA